MSKTDTLTRRGNGGVSMATSTSKATKRELRDEIQQLRIVGEQMAHLCFNLSQQDRLEPYLQTTMGTLYRQWDAIRRSEP